MKQSVCVGKNSRQHEVVEELKHHLEDIAEENQIVKGAIVALEDDLRLRRALSVANNIEFFKFKVDFELFKVV